MNMSLPSAAADSTASSSVAAGIGREDRVGVLAEPRARLRGEAARSAFGPSTMPPRISSAFQPASSGTLLCSPSANVSRGSFVNSSRRRSVRTAAAGRPSSPSAPRRPASRAARRASRRQAPARTPRPICSLTARGGVPSACGTGREEGAALANRAMEQPARERRGHERADGERARRTRRRSSRCPDRRRTPRCCPSPTGARRSGPAGRSCPMRDAAIRRSDRDARGSRRRPGDS